MWITVYLYSSHQEKQNAFSSFLTSVFGQWERTAQKLVSDREVIWAQIYWSQARLFILLHFIILNKRATEMWEMRSLQ